MNDAEQPAGLFVRQRRRIALAMMALVMGLQAIGCSDTSTTTLELRGAETDTRFVTPTGPGGRQFVSRSPKGWTIAVPDSSPTDAIGLTSKAVIHGDFLLEAAYEIEAMQQPITGAGIGPSLYVAVEGGSKNAAQLARLNRVKEGPVISSAFLFTSKNGRRRHDVEFSPSEANSGRLRLERRGGTMTYSSQEADGKWSEQRQVEFGLQPVSTMRIALERGGEATAATVHWTEISLRLSELPLSWASTKYRRVLFLGGAMLLPVLLVAVWMMSDYYRYRSVVVPVEPPS